MYILNVPMAHVHRLVAVLNSRTRSLSTDCRKCPCTESIIPHRKLCMIREKPRCPRHPRSQSGLCGWFSVFSPMNLLLNSFRLGDSSGFSTFPQTRLLPYSFRLGDFPGSPAFPQKRHKKGCPKLTVR